MKLLSTFTLQKLYICAQCAGGQREYWASTGVGGWWRGLKCKPSRWNRSLCFSLMWTLFLYLIPHAVKVSNFFSMVSTNRLYSNFCLSLGTHAYLGTYSSKSYLLWHTSSVYVPKYQCQSAYFLTVWEKLTITINSSIPSSNTHGWYKSTYKQQKTQLFWWFKSAYF